MKIRDYPESFFQTFRYILSTPQASELPQSKLFAFLGRSNSGKSSLLNEIVGMKGLAKVSKTPGKTKLLNLFQNEEKISFIDLPGFGYSKASLTEHKQMMEILESFLNQSKGVSALFILCDSKRPLPEDEIHFLEIAQQKKMNPVLVRTKVDKLNQSEKHKLKTSMEQLMLTKGIVFPFFLTSSIEGKGIEELRNWIYKKSVGI